MSTHLDEHNDPTCLLCRDEAFAILNDSQALFDLDEGLGEATPIKEA